MPEPTKLTARLPNAPPDVGAMLADRTGMAEVKFILADADAFRSPVFPDRPAEITINWQQLRDQLEAASRTGEASDQVMEFVQWRTAVLRTEIDKRFKIQVLLIARMNAKRANELDDMCALDTLLLSEYRIPSPACEDIDACERMAKRTAIDLQRMPREVRVV